MRKSKMQFRATARLQSYLEAGLTRFLDAEITPEKVQEIFTSVISSAHEARLKFGSQADTPIKTVLMLECGKVLTLARVHDLSWRLAASRKRLNEGKGLLSCFEKGPLFVAPLEIMNMYFFRMSKTNHPLLKVKFRVMGGDYGGLTFEQVLPLFWVVGKLAKVLGSFGYRRPDYRELCGFWMAGVVDTSNPEFPRVTNYEESSAAVAHNRALRKLRDDPCPRGFKVACHLCPLGGVAEDPKFMCVQLDEKKDYKLARPAHSSPYLGKFCASCKKKSFFDPEHKTKMCVSCQNRKVFLTSM